MDAANSLCRFLLLAVALCAMIGCQNTEQARSIKQHSPSPSDNNEAVQAQRARNEAAYVAQNSTAMPVTARPQMPTEERIDPLAPVAPPPMPPSTAPSPVTPLTPITPMTPTPGVVPAVAGSPVPADAKGPVVGAGFTQTKTIPNAAQLLKESIPRVKVVAIVGASNVITDQEVIESVWQQNEELVKLTGREREAKVKELYTVALRKMIERELILDDMYTKLKKANKTAVIDEIRETAAQMADRHIRDIKKKTMSKTNDEFVAWLRVQGLTLPVLRRQLERQMMAQQYLSSMFKEKGRRVGLAEIRDYYDKHPQEFQTDDRVRWQHIFISLRNHATAQDAFNHAEAIHRQAASGNDFGALAKQHDEGFAKMQNGFGSGETRGKIQPLDLEATVWAMKPGEVSQVLQTPTGYHIVRIVERDYAGVLPFDAKVQGKIRDKLSDTFTEAETKKLIEALWRKGVVRVLED